VNGCKTSSSKVDKPCLTAVSACDKASPTFSVKGCITLSSNADKACLAAVSAPDNKPPTSLVTGLIKLSLIADKATVIGSTKSPIFSAASPSASSITSGRIVPPSATYLPTPFNKAFSISSP